MTLFTAGHCSTAAELTMIMAETEARLAPVRQRLSRMADDMLAVTFGREVSAQRARKLRRRGHAVVRLARRTSTGKPRFCWMARIRFTGASL